VATRSGAKAGKVSSPSDCAASPKSRAAASAPRSRAILLTLLAKLGNRLASAIATRMERIASLTRIRSRIATAFLDRLAGPLIFIPIMTASYAGIAQSKTDQASALINAARNTGGSIGVSIVSNVLTHREQFHQSRLVESVVPSNAQYQDTLQQVMSYFTAHGGALARAHDQAIQWIGQQVRVQASFLAYMDEFWVLMLISLAAVLLAIALRKVKLGGAAVVGH